MSARWQRNLNDRALLEGADWRITAVLVSVAVALCILVGMAADVLL